MSLRSRISSAYQQLRGNPLDNPAIPLSAGGWLYSLFGAQTTEAGVAVNEETSMRLATVFTCVSTLARDISTLPLVVYETVGKDRQPAVDADLYNLITVQPNPEMSAPVFWSCWYGCAILTGNGYAEIQRSGSTPVALWPLHPRAVRPKRNALNDLTYEVSGPTGVRILQPANVLHLRGFTLDGWLGLSPVQAARQTIGTAIAAEKFGAGFFGRGTRPSGLLTGPELKAGKAENLDEARRSWEHANSGDNQGRTAVLPTGWTWTQIGISPEESQFLETQQYTRTQIAALFGMPPHKVGDTSRLSNSNHESQALEYAVFTLRPWLVNGESEVNCKLMPRLGRKANSYSAEHDLTQLVRGDFKTQMDGLAVGRQWGAITGNEWRRRIGLNPVPGPGGDMLLVPLNMVPADSLQASGDDSAAEGVESAGDGAGGATDDLSADGSAQGNGGRNQRLLLQRLAAAYGPLIADACLRLSKRSRRDTEAVAHVFGPVCEAIAAEARREAAQIFRIDLSADPAADLGTERALRDYRKAVEKRAAAWTPEALPADEADRAVRAILLPIFREAGGHIALSS